VTVATGTDRGRAPNIRDVAALAGVSHQTVSRVLNDSASLRSATRERVEAAIRELGYRPNPAARALVTSRSRTIGVLSVESASHYGPTTAITSIEVAAREAGYRLSITNLTATSPADIAGAIDYLLSQSVEALVVIAPQVGVFEIIADLSVTVPLVTLESSGRDPRHSVSVDQIAGARLATRHLIELGHTGIVHLAGPQDWIEAGARLRGFQEEMERAGLPARAPLLGDWSAESGYLVGQELVRDLDGVTAVFAGNDQMALGLVHACREAGLAVPGDVSVVGFDDVPESAHYVPPLTTVRQNFAELGRRAVAVLLAELGGGDASAHEPVPAELVVRASTAPPER